MKKSNKNFRNPPECNGFSEAFRYFWLHGIGNRLDRNGDPVPWNSTDLEGAFEDIGSHISQRSIEKWLSGHAKPSRRNIHRIARIAGSGDDKQKQAWADFFIRCMSEPKAERTVPVDPVNIPSVPPEQPSFKTFETPDSTRSYAVTIDDTASLSGPVISKIWWILIIVCLLAGFFFFKTQRNFGEATPVQVKIGINPFSTDTLDQSGDFILSGLRSDLGYSLAQLDDIKLITPRELISADPNLQPNYLINGSMERIDGRQNIRLWLTELDNQGQLWARNFDLQFFSISEVNSVALKDIGSTVGLDIPPSRLAEIVQFGMADPDAHIAYLKGRHLLKNWHETHQGNDLWRANQLFEEALTIDPTFGLAAFHSGDAFYHLAAGDIDKNPFIEEKGDISALEEIRHAMRLAGQAAQTPTENAQARVNHVFFSNDWSDLKRTAKTYALSAQTERGELEWFFGPISLLFTQQDGALRDLVDNRMARFDPLNGTVHAYKARSALISGDYEAAEKILKDTNITSFSSRIEETKGYLLLAQGDATGLNRHLNLSKGLSNLHKDYLHAMLLSLEGHNNEALAELRASTALKDESFHLAIGLARVGKIDASKQLLTQMETDEMGMQIIASQLAYGAGCGDISIEFGPGFMGRLQDANLDLPACVGITKN